MRGAWRRDGAIACSQVTRITRQPWASRMRWRSWSAARSNGSSWWGPSASITSRCSGQQEVRHDPAACEEQRRIDRGVGEAAAQDQIQHGVLELALGRRASVREDTRELLAAARGPGPVQHGDERARRVVSLRNCAWRTARRSRRSGSSPARSSSVRSAVVTGIPRTVVTCSAGRYEVRWPLIRGCRGMLAEDEHVRIPVLPRDDVQERCRRPRHSTASAPHALTAARSQPVMGHLPWPTA